MSTLSVDAPPAAAAPAAGAPAILARHGNTAIVVLDAALTEAAGLAPGAPLRVTVVDRQIVIEAAPPADDRVAALRSAAEQSHGRYAEAYRKLAE